MGATNAATGTLHEIASVTSHPQFELVNPSCIENADPDNLCDWYDIAVVVLANPVTAQPPAPVLPNDDLDLQLVDGAQLAIAGYGYDSPSGESKGMLHVGAVSFLRKQGIEMALGRADEARTCNVDSGGPAYLVVDGVPHLVGVTSRATEGNDGECTRHGTVYTMAPTQDSWLKEATNGAYPRPGSLSAPPTQAGAVEADSEGGCSIAVNREGRGVGWAGQLLVALAMGAWVRRRRS